MEAGVLALQGGFREHATVLRRLGANCREVKLPHDFDGLDVLIVPGGESTTIGKLAVEYGLIDPIVDFARQNKPIWGTCAGAIFLSKLTGVNQPVLRLIDIEVERNAFGRQVDSFEAEVTITLSQMPGNENSSDRLHAGVFPGVFIRAPRVVMVGPSVDVLGRLSTGEIVAARQKNLLVTVFHPELTDDHRFHEYFLGMLPDQVGVGLRAD